MNSDTIQALMHSEPVRSCLLGAMAQGLAVEGIKPCDNIKPAEMDGAMAAAIEVMVFGLRNYLREVPLSEMPEEVAREYLSMTDREEVAVICAPSSVLVTVSELAGRAAAEYLTRAIRTRLAARTPRAEDN